MSGPGTPSFLEHGEPYRHIRLREVGYIVDPEDPEDVVPEKTVWARPCADGWIGWHYKAFMTTQIRVIWLKGMWEEVPLKPEHLPTVDGSVTT